MAKAEYIVQNLDLRHIQLDNIVTDYTAIASACKSWHIHATGSMGLWLHRIFIFSIHSCYLFLVKWKDGYY